MPARKTCSFLYLVKKPTIQNDYNRKHSKRIAGFGRFKYQEFHSALVPGIGNILGVRIPQLRILAKEIAKRDNWRMFVEATDTKFYEETMLQEWLSD